METTKADASRIWLSAVFSCFAFLFKETGFCCFWCVMIVCLKKKKKKNLCLVIDLKPFLCDEGSAGGTTEKLPAPLGNRGTEPDPQHRRDRLSHLLLPPAARRGHRAQRVSAHLLQVRCNPWSCSSVICVFWLLPKSLQCHVPWSAKCAEVNT